LTDSTRTGKSRPARTIGSNTKYGTGASDDQWFCKTLNDVPAVVECDHLAIDDRPSGSFAKHS
jgi:hypothetical protein